ncbi:flavodoxin family protein [Lachnotalea glycerini]|uniref:Flavodoxin family protein n=1 Tax=Lachnotalea glycerini TaxID=1763509 RepID=A0A371JGS4_9FIRM|nr:flavodoxin family protein [Lachnotalea glycerini]RDY31935.1 flavodoxin family protein [Lachnotalea glycerini]
MKITVFNGSPKGARGVTYELQRCLCDGIEGAGGNVEIINLIQKKINRCLGCMGCWQVHEGICIIKDDMIDLIHKLLTSDLVVLATPLYFNNVTLSLKTFLERLMPLSRRSIIQGEDNVYRHACAERIPPIVMFSTCGLPDYINFNLLSQYGDLLAEHWGTKIVGEIYRTEAYLFEANFENTRILLKSYRKMLHNAGAELVEAGELSKNTMQKLNRNLVPSKVYVDISSQYQFGLKK